MKSHCFKKGDSATAVFWDLGSAQDDDLVVVCGGGWCCWEGFVLVVLGSMVFLNVFFGFWGLVLFFGCFSSLFRMFAKGGFLFFGGFSVFFGGFIAVL